MCWYFSCCFVNVFIMFLFVTLRRLIDWRGLTSTVCDVKRLTTQGVDITCRWTKRVLGSRLSRWPVIKVTKKSFRSSWLTTLSSPYRTRTVIQLSITPLLGVFFKKWYTIINFVGLILSYIDKTLHIVQLKIAVR